jgi:glucose-1-phosphate thymidylyltransferase
MTVRSTKAVILARGLGSRMRRDDAGAALSAEQASLADTGMKAMIPVGRPFLDYVVSGLADARVADVCLVIGPEHDRIRDYYSREVRVSRLRLSFAVQREAKGTADALLAAREFAAADHFLVLNADNYYPVESYRALLELGVPGLPGFDREALLRLSNIDRDRIRQYALLQTDRDGRLVDIVEKPDEHDVARMGEHARVSMNLWYFSPSIFEACEAIAPSPRGELELPNAVRHAIRTLGHRLTVLPMALGVLDLSRRGDVATVADRLRGVDVAL